MLVKFCLFYIESFNSNSVSTLYFKISTFWLIMSTYHSTIFFPFSLHSVFVCNKAFLIRSSAICSLFRLKKKGNSIWCGPLLFASSKNNFYPISTLNWRLRTLNFSTVIFFSNTGWPMRNGRFKIEPVIATQSTFCQHFSIGQNSAVSSRQALKELLQSEKYNDQEP